MSTEQSSNSIKSVTSHKRSMDKKLKKYKNKLKKANNTIRKLESKIQELTDAKNSKEVYQTIATPDIITKTKSKSKRGNNVYID